MEVREYFVLVGIIFLCFFGIPIRISNDSSQNEEELFKSYIKKFNKSYSEKDPTYQRKFENFKNSLRLIQDLNNNRSSNESAIYGLTEFSDLSQEEFIQTRLLKTYRKPYIRYHELGNHNRSKRSGVLPKKVDWRESGVISAVNNQRNCGACWAFSVVETIEAMNAIKTGSLVKLSVQEVIDCARFGNYGCEGGDSCSLLGWLMSTKTKITTEKLYPFMFKTGLCKAVKPKTGIQISTFTCANFVGAEGILERKIALHGPVAVAVNAINWQYYLGGIIQYHCSGSIHDLNHAVQIVGYDRTGPVPFYIARNSWGPDFGNKGYIYIAMGGNLCGVANEVTFLDVL